MDQDIIEAPPTSTAATRETEPEVVAGISSAGGNPTLPLSFRVGGTLFGFGRLSLMLAGGLALGFGAAWWLRRRDG